MQSMLDANRLNQGLPAKLTHGVRANGDLSNRGARVSAGPNARRKLNAAPWSGTWPAPGATMDFDFVNNRGYIKSSKRGVLIGKSTDFFTNFSSITGFTRNSQATYVGEDGLLKTANNNEPRFDWANQLGIAKNSMPHILLGGYNFQYAGMVTGNSGVAPDGSYTAIQINYNGYARTQVGYTQDIYTFSMYVNGGSSIRISLSVDNNSYDITFNTTNNTFSSIGSSLKSYGSQFVGDGWYRIWIVAEVGDYYGSMNIGINGSSGNPLIWGMQLESGSSPTEYFNRWHPAYNVPMYASSESVGLKVEQSDTNNALWCRDATQSCWICDGLVPALDQDGIDGVGLSASSLTATSDNATCSQSLTLGSSQRIGGFFLKSLSGSKVVGISIDGSNWSDVEISDSEWRSVGVSATLSNPILSLKLPKSGDSVAMDYAILSTYTTTPILTTTTAVTRAAELPALNPYIFFDSYKQFRTWVVSSLNAYYPICFSPWSGGISEAIKNDYVYNGGAHIIWPTPIPPRGRETIHLVSKSPINPYRITYNASCKTAKNSFLVYNQANLQIVDTSNRITIGARDIGDVYTSNSTVKRVIFFDNEILYVQGFST